MFREIAALGHAHAGRSRGVPSVSDDAIPGAAAGAGSDAANGLLKGAFAVSENICVFCGGQATTSDHIPPRGIFPKPLPSNSNLITVPACQKCNQGSSQDDEQFRNYVALSVSADKNFESTEYQKEPAKRSAKSFQRNSGRGLKNLEPALVLINNEYKPVFTARAEYCVTGRVIVKIVRGLYFYHFRSIFPKDKKIYFEIQNYSRKGVFDFFKNWPLRCSYIVDKDIFCYKFEKMPDKDISLWLFTFYGNTKIGAITDSERFEYLKQSSLSHDSAL